LTMHLALALCKPTVALFTCTSPYEIYGYGRMRKIVNPRLHECFYRRDVAPGAEDDIPLERVAAEVAGCARGPVQPG